VPATAPDASSRHSNLTVRILAAIVLVPIALGAAYIGGWPWLLLVILGASGLFAEWQVLIASGSRDDNARKQSTIVLIAGILLLVAAAVALNLHDLGASVICIVAAALLCATFSVGDLRLWAGLGAVYAGIPLLAAMLLRQDHAHGFEALLFVFLVVWATDILGYFGGRRIGGPRLWLRVSPNKTWAGALSGMVGSVALAVVFAWIDGRSASPLAGLAAALSAISQAGDLCESAVKRRFGVKDSSHLIPGHGGLLDRLDGFVAAVAAAALIGAVRSGTSAAGQGLLIW
jgi:phosphatidate cytidylyltransferase